MIATPTGTTGKKIVVKGLSKEFAARGRRLLALDDINLSVADGEVICIVGPSGCGKSTLLSLIAGFDKPTSGSILVGERTVNAPGPDRGVVLQVPALFPWLTVRKNIVSGPRWRGEKRAHYEAEADQLLQSTGLDGFAHHYPYQLSGGMQQRVAIARAMAGSPEVLLLDEPFGALDAQTRLQMQLLVLGIWRRFNTTVVFVTHDVDEALMLGDRVLVLSKRPGRLMREIASCVDKAKGRAVFSDPQFVSAKAELLNELFPDDAVDSKGP